MIVKGILKTINYSDNSCTVRLPIFETVATSGEVILKAIFLNQPGNYDGYAENDVVFVDFENDQLDCPIIIGKLYCGAAKEIASTKKSGLSVANLTVATSASIPIDTKLVLDNTNTAVPVDNGLTSYKSILDIIKALHKTEASVDTVNKQSLETISSIKVEYLSQLATAIPPIAENPNWQTATPAYKDDYAIWQKTTCFNNRGQILSTEIICLSSLSSAASYRLRCSTRVHAGEQQKEAIEIRAMVKFGAELETEDTSELTTLEYKWGIDGEVIVSNHKIIIEQPNFENKNLIIIAKRNGVIYDSETIVYAPFNTPIITLTNENDSIEYDSYGFNKIDDEYYTTSSASVSLNNNNVNATYKWILKNCYHESSKPNETVYAEDIEVANVSSINIYHIAEAADSGTATCYATYNDNLGNPVTLSKVFSINKNKQGKSMYKIDISNDYVTIPAIYNTEDPDQGIIIDPNYEWDLTEHTVTVFYGDSPIEFTCSATNPAQDTSVKNFHLKFIVDEDITLGTSPVKSTASTSTKTILDSLTSSVGNIIYELYRGVNKVASAKFEATRLDPGAAAISRWINVSRAVHTGPTQIENILIQPKYQVGSAAIQADLSAEITCKYVDEDGTEITTVRDSTNGEITITADNNLEAYDIIIEAKHNGIIYESETITYSPLNTPTLDLSNDSDDLVYDQDDSKLNDREVATSTADLWLNGKKIADSDVTYNWTLSGCQLDKNNNATTYTGKTITIKHLTAPKGTATCKATYSYNGVLFEPEKAFTIAKQLKGDSTVSYWLVPSTTSLKIDADGKLVNESKQVTFNVIKKSGLKEPVAINIVDENLVGETDLQLIIRLDGIPSIDKVTYNATTKAYALDTSTVKSSVVIELKNGDLVIDKETLNTVADGIKGDTGNSIVIEHLYKWIDDYPTSFTTIVDTPDKKPNEITKSVTATNFENSDVNTWYKITNGNQPTRFHSTYKIVYLCKITGTYNPVSNETTWNDWEPVTVYKIADEKAYNILKTSESLFGYGQGVYYTPAPQRDENGKIIGDKEITLDDGITKYKTGQKISQQVATDYVAAKPSERKDHLELYIDAEYIRTGAFRVEKDTNDDGKKETIFEAGLNSGNVTIGGWQVDSDSLKIGTIGSSNSACVSSTGKSATIGDNTKSNWGITLGPNFGVDLDGNLQASAGIIGGFNISDDSIYNGTASMSSPKDGVYLGTKGIKLGNKFKVTTTGDLTATGGNIGGFNITESALTNYLFKAADLPSIQAEPYSILTSWGDNWGTFTQVTDVKIDGYACWKSAEITHSEIAVLKIIFNQSLPAFNIYIASSSEAGWDYIMASTINCPTSPMPSSASSEYCLANTKDEYNNITNHEITKYKKVNYVNIKQNDYIYIIYRKDSSITRYQDCGFVLLPANATLETQIRNAAIVGQTNSIWLAPEGGTGTVGNISKENWGLTLGSNFGVDLNGVLVTANADIKGTITATNGNIGGFEISEASGLSAPGLSITPQELSITKGTNRLEFGATSTTPYISFEGNGKIADNYNSCGFIFSGDTYSSAIKYRARVYYSYSNPSFNPIKIELEIQEKDANGEWYRSTNGLLAEKSFKLYCYGRANVFDGSDQKWYPTITIAKGSSYGYVESNGGWFNFKSATHNSNKQTTLEFNQYATSSGIVKSIGSIVPENADNSCTLGVSGYRWNKLWAKDITSSSEAVTDSDFNLKNNIDYDLSSYDMLFDALKPAKYLYNNSESGRTHLGFIAQDIEKSIFDTGLTRKDFSIITIDGVGFNKKLDTIEDKTKITYGLRYSQLHALEVRQIQLLKQEVKELKAEIEELKSKIK